MPATGGFRRGQRLKALERAKDILAVDLNGLPGSVRAARARTARYLADERDETGLTGPLVTDILLVVAELVANACRHAPGPCRLTVAPRRDGVMVAVRDNLTTPMSLVCMKPPAGYGLLIVARLTRGIDVLPIPGGKIVSAEVPLPALRPTLE